MELKGTDVLFELIPDTGEIGFFCYFPSSIFFLNLLL